MIDSTKSLTVEQKITRSLQEALAIVLLEGMGQLADDIPGGATQLSLSTITRATAIAESQGWAELMDDAQGRRRLRAIIRHQVNYLRRAIDGRLMGDTDSQIKDDPTGYEDYLRGVYETHRGHSMIIATHEALHGATNLIDIGSGLGAFSSAWITSSSSRKATMMDLPDVLPIIQRSPEFGTADGERLALLPIDLRTSFALPLDGDVYLLSNVLHLFSDWQRILRHVASQLPIGKILVIFDVAPDSSLTSKMFDLMVNLRSDSEGALFDLAEAGTILGELWTTDVVNIEVDAYDYFARSYKMAISRKISKIGS
ncbi:MAG TPA: methyltransferase [Nitrospira sp.]|nr:methyltransferase [Nitrospira sp.]